MKPIFKLAMLTAATFLSAGSVWAQTIATATIPFSFNVQQRQLPQGKYQVVRLSAGTIEMRREDGTAYAAVITMPSDKVKGHENKLTFHRYGDQYFLSEVQISTTDTALKVPSCKAEKQAQRDEASLSPTSTALVALK